VVPSSVSGDALLGSSDGDASEAGRQATTTAHTRPGGDGGCVVGFGSDTGNHGRRGSLQGSREVRSSPAMAATRGMGGFVVFR
jgi:hypothetical protein